MSRIAIVAFSEFEDGEVTSPGFRKQLAQTFSAGSPFMRFLTDAVGLPW